MTQQDHLAAMTQWTSQNQQTVGVSPNVILQFVDYSNRKLWKFYAATRPTDFRKLYTGITDGDRIATDWTAWAGSASYVDGGGATRPFHYVRPNQIAFENNNFYGAAQTYYPAFLIEDLKIRTIPAGLTGISIWGFNQPVAMLGATPTTDDGMPAWLTNLVHLEAAEAIRELSMDEQKAVETLLRRQKEADEIDQNFMAMLEAAMQSDVRSTIKQ